MNSAILLDIKALCVGYQTQMGLVHALHDVNLQIRRQEVSGLVGESGSGKTTLAWTILQYLGPAGKILSGEISFNGDNLLEKNESQIRHVRGKQISMIYQDPMSSLNPSKRVGEQIAEVIRYHDRTARGRAADKTVHLLDQLGIADPEKTARNYPHQLSGGMQQRVVTAMAVACNPQLLIMDEPTTALDVTTQAKLLKLVQELKSVQQWSILYITHDLAIVAQVADSVNVIYSGVVLETGSVNDVFLRPVHPYTQGLLECVPQADLVKSENYLASIPGSLPNLLTLKYDSCVFTPRCPIAEEDCKSKSPAMLEVESNHFVRCNRAKVKSSPLYPRTSGYKDKLIDYQHSSETTASELILSANGIRVYFTRHGYTQGRFRRPPKHSLKAVDGVDVVIRAGETLALVGETGCGKTTLARAIGQLIPPTSGSVLYHNKCIDSARKLADFRRRVQFIFQNPDSALNPTRRIGAILGRAVKRATKGDAVTQEKEVTRLLNLVGLPKDTTARYPHELSGGQKQRVGIARAFAYNPELVICDEPTAALDVSVQASILNLFIDLQEEFKTAYLFISHDLSIVRFLASYVVVMYLGRACEVGRTEEVFLPPYHPYTEALLSAIPSSDPNVNREPILLEGAVPSPMHPPKGCRFQTRCPKKIGFICEKSVPLLNKINETHRIACHLHPKNPGHIASARSSMI
jgi:peptide/nickel transport system ATP-binding protein